MPVESPKNMELLLHLEHVQTAWPRLSGIPLGSKSLDFVVHRFLDTIIQCVCVCLIVDDIYWIFVCSPRRNELNMRTNVFAPRTLYIWSASEALF